MLSGLQVYLSILRNKTKFNILFFEIKLELSIGKYFL